MQLKLEQLWRMFVETLLSDLGISDLKSLSHCNDDEFDHLLERYSVVDPAEKAFMRTKFKTEVQNLNLASTTVELKKEEQDVEVDIEMEEEQPINLLVDNIWARKRAELNLAPSSMPMSMQQNSITTVSEGQCSLCEGISIDDLTQLMELRCGHQTCFQCLHQFVQKKMGLGQHPILCPSGNCETPLSEDFLLKLVGAEAIEHYKTMISLLSIPGVRKCPNPSCDYTFCWEEDQDPHLRCEKCKGHYCLSCGGEYHQNVTCIQYQNGLKQNERQMMEFIDLCLHEPGSLRTM